MPTRTVEFTPEEDAFIEQLVSAGEYADADEVVRAAVGRLQRERAIDARKQDRLRRYLAKGAAELESGNYTEVDEADLAAFLDELVETPRD